MHNDEVNNPLAQKKPQNRQKATHEKKAQNFSLIAISRWKSTFFALHSITILRLFQWLMHTRSNERHLEENALPLCV